MLTLRNCMAGVLRRIKPAFKLKPYSCVMAAAQKHTVGADPNSKLIWIDLELTGLSIEKDVILEATCVITESNLDIVATCPDLIIHQPENILSGMNSWCQETHLKTGLINSVRESNLTVEKAEEHLLKFVRTYTEPNTCPLAGNTVYMDRLFLSKYMPKLEEHLHYRIVDVSSVKELCRRWAPDLYSKAPHKTFVHRASADIHESIEELKYYKSCMFRV